MNIRFRAIGLSAVIAVLAGLSSAEPSLATGAGVTTAPLPATVFMQAPLIGQPEVKGVGNQPKAAAPTRGPNLSVAPVLLAQGYVREMEPNNTFSTATPISGSNLVIQAPIFPNGDIDFYSFSANAGDRVYAAAMTSASANGSNDSQLTLLASDGSTVIEFDDDDGSFGSFSSSIAGATIPSAGTYYLQVKHFSATNQFRPYELHFRIQSGAPTPEVEPNDTPGTATPLPASGWVSGARDPALATEQDWYSFALNAGDTVFLSLDLDPERDGTTWNGRLGFGLFGDANNQILTADDAGTADAIPSEAFFMTVKTAGMYYAFVDSGTAATGGPTATYHLSVSVHPAIDEGVNCTTYTSTNVPQTIGPAAGLVSSTITIPGNPRIADLDVAIVLDHALMADIDMHLRSPAGNDNGLFTDIGATATGGQTQMDLVLDDEAGIPPTFTVVKGLAIKPELAYRLSWFDGEDAGGVWTLDIRDDTTNASGGTLTSWSMRVCEMPPPPTCPPGTGLTTVYSTDFESGAAGFTHSGTADEWELGLPASPATSTGNPLAAFTSCNSGSNCWKTDLDGTYDVSSNQNLLSPLIDLTGLVAPVTINWAQRYQMENATFDHLSVDFQQVGGATPVRLFEWLDATMTNVVGNPAMNIGASAGWAQMSGRADSLAGLNSELRFHVDSDPSLGFQGLAVDDVSVTACRALTSDLSITKTDGVTAATPGANVSYTITASNAGPDAATGATVADTFPAACVSPTWTCVGAGGGTCAAAGSGNINDSVNLPSGGSVTYTATCPINASATGNLVNTATVTAPAGVNDPTPGNNSATDTDTLNASANLGITKTDGVTSATPGTSTTYTITANNIGPSNATGATVADTFPAACVSPTWTCVGAGGGTCTAVGSGNINATVNLPSGGSVTYTATCPISAAATGSLVNTATVAVPAGVTDPTPANNSATDTDTLNASANLGITKTDGVTSATPGGSTSYTITANNVGPSNATGATVADTFPAACVSPTWTCVGAGTGTCTAAGSGNINATVNLPSGGSVVYTATCPISAAATGSLVNTATVTVSAGVTDPTPGNNSATDTDTLSASANLGITKTDGVTSATPGGSTTYTITANNVGPSNATGATVADTFPAACVSPTWTCVGAGGGTCAAAGSGNINATVNLPTGGSVTYTATCPVNASAMGSLTNTATVTVPAGVTDPVPGNNSATDIDALGASADLSITKTDGVTSVNSGATLTYTIVARNTGPSAVTGATVSDTFPAQCTSSNWTCVGAGGGTCAAAGSGAIADSVNLPVAATATYTASCPTNAATPNGTVISNTANIAAPAMVTDTNPSNNTATDTTTAVLLGTNITATKTASGGDTPGSALTYTIVIANAGPGVQGDNPGDEFVDVLPPQLTLVSATASSGTAVANVGSNTVNWNGSIASGASVTITINASINNGIPGGPVSNQGTVNHDADGNGTNESTLLTDDPSAVGTANPTTVNINIPLGPILPVPALHWLALLALMLGLGIVARRRLMV